MGSLSETITDLTHQDDSRSGEGFLNRVKQSARAVLGDSETGRQVARLCDEHAVARDLIARDRSGGALVVAVVGATGQGKSWLIRQLVRRSPVARSIRSGNNAEQATEKLMWVGPSPPADLDNRYEQFLRISRDEMEPMGAPYLLVDAPGATDDRESVSAVARRALSLASGIILVVCRDQIRGKTPGNLAVASEGTIVIPVVNTIGKRDVELDADLDAYLANLRAAAPSSIIAPPILVDDFQREGRDETEVGSAAAGDVVERLKIELANNPDSDRRKNVRLAALDERFKSALRGLLSDELPGLTAAVNRLNEEAEKLPGEVAESLIGAKGPMHAAIRSRLRLRLLTGTAAIWFPYRTLLGTLNLTHGAWDRVLLSLSGSLPSLVSTIWTSTQSLVRERDANDEMRDGLQRRSAAAVTDRIGPLAAQFRDELALLRSGVEPESDLARAEYRGASSVASLAGIETLQQRSQTIFEDAIEENGISGTAALLFSIVGTAIFWVLMAGPFFALYSEYLRACVQSLAGGEPTLEHFPTPEFATVLTSLILSVLPTAIFAMIVLSISQSSSRVRSVETRIRDGHRVAIEELQSQRVLRLRWDDALLSDAEFLVSAGSGR